MSLNLTCHTCQFYREREGDFFAARGPEEEEEEKITIEPLGEPRGVRLHMSCFRPSSHGKKILVWPGLCVLAFLAGFENLTVQGRCCQNFE